MKIIKAEVIGEMKHYAIDAEIQSGRTFFLITATLTEMYDANTDSTEYDFTTIDSDNPVVLTPAQKQDLKAKAIEWIEAKKCSICGQPEDEDGRCGCVNADANA